LDKTASFRVGGLVALCGKRSSGATTADMAHGALPKLIDDKLNQSNEVMEPTQLIVNKLSNKTLKSLF
jgi:hypothetical protein